MVLESAGEDVVGAPPAEEESAEEEGGAEAVPETRDAMVAQELTRAVDGAARISSKLFDFHNRGTIF